MRFAQVTKILQVGASHDGQIIKSKINRTYS